MADLKALEAYATYFYHLSKVWSKPLPEVYDPESISDYFNCRPHVVAFRLVEVVKSILYICMYLNNTDTIAYFFFLIC